METTTTYHRGFESNLWFKQGGTTTLHRDFEGNL